ncbi:MAG: metallopeptidase family protein [Actinomycetaceae bacterium]|nr:metallopeptidase family protein [Actinomycetaceae bacterium]
MALRRDRRGRGPRGVIIPPTLPGGKTRSQRFDALVTQLAKKLTQIHPQVADFEFAVEDVPPSSPPPWNTQSPVLAKSFSPRRGSGLKTRIVLYRLPIVNRATVTELPALIADVMYEQVEGVLGEDPLF